MKYISNIPVYLLAFIFLVFGSNYFLHFLTMPPMDGNAGAYTGLLFTTGFLAFVKVLEVAIALFLLVKPTRALGLLLIAPIVVNILAFELFIVHKPGIGILLLILNVLAIYNYRNKYMGIISA